MEESNDCRDVVIVAKKVPEDRGLDLAPWPQYVSGKESPMHALDLVYSKSRFCLKGGSFSQVKQKRYGKEKGTYIGVEKGPKTIFR